jgi:hypothetical protein
VKRQGEGKESKAREERTLLSIHLTLRTLLVIMTASILSSCGTFAPLDPAAPASHHAQRKYDEAVKKGTVVPAEKGQEDRK